METKHVAGSVCPDLEGLEGAAEAADNAYGNVAILKLVVCSDGIHRLLVF